MEVTQHRICTATTHSRIKSALQMCKRRLQRGEVIYASLVTHDRTIGRPFKYVSRARRWFEAEEEVEQSWLPFEHYNPWLVVVCAYDVLAETYYITLRQGQRSYGASLSRFVRDNIRMESIKALELYEETSAEETSAEETSAEETSAEEALSPTPFIEDNRSTSTERAPGSTTLSAEEWANLVVLYDHPDRWSQVCCQVAAHLG